MIGLLGLFGLLGLLGFVDSEGSVMQALHHGSQRRNGSAMHASAARCATCHFIALLGLVLLTIVIELFLKTFPSFLTQNNNSLTFCSFPHF